MSLSELSKYVFTSKYARYLPEKKRRETWHEAVTRVKEMHLARFPDLAEEINWAFDFVYKKRVSPSQRTLQFGGEPILKHNTRSYNCCATYVDRPRVFQEILYCLLCGTGTGFSVQKQHVDKLPELYYGPKQSKTFIIPDSIEGWSDAIGVLISSYFVEVENTPHPDFARTEVTFDYSQIRPKGTPLSSGSGKAPGPKPLEVAIEKVRSLFDDVIISKQIKLKPIQAHDIICHLADAVLSGGVRRSSCISLFSSDDIEMMEAKTGDWFYTNPQRARANNSVALNRKKTTKEQFYKLVENIKQYGEPGISLSDLDGDEAPNPCHEISLYPQKEGKSGIQFCNLSSINSKKCKTAEEFYEAAKAAAIIGTLQAAYTDFPYLGETTEEITRKEALLGVCLSGMMDNPDISINPEIQKKAAQIVLQTNKEFAQKLGINPSARTTSVKPSGTDSLVAETSAGIHPHHSRRYFRRAQANDTESVALYFAKHNPLAVEKSVWGSSGTDLSLIFCVETEERARTKNEVSAIDLLKAVKTTKDNWIQYGKDESLCSHPALSHNVSNTIHIKDNEWGEVIDYIYENINSFGGISFLPHSGDLDYHQPPFCAVHTPKEILKKYGDASIFASGLIVDGVNCFGDLWIACDAVLGRLNQFEETPEIKQWIYKVSKFAHKYYDGDIRKVTYLMKEVYNWKKWLDLNASYQQVDYTILVEGNDNTSLEDNLACSGGSCEII